MSTPTPSRDPRDWVGAKHAVRAFYASDRSATRCVGRVISYTDQPTVTVEMPDGSREDWLASLCEPTAEPTAEILPAASAPQGDTADVIERARCVLAESYDGIDPDVETRHDGAVANLSAAGLLAASPAAPQTAEVDRPMVPHPSISESHIVPEVHITFRELADGEWDTSTWTEVAPGVNVQKDKDGRLACIEVETWKHAAVKPAAPAPADNEAAAKAAWVAFKAAYIDYQQKNPSWRGHWTDHHAYAFAAALAALKEGQKA